VTEPRLVLVAGRSYRVAASYAPRKNPEGKCSHCGRWVGTFKRTDENQLRARGHKSNQGAGTFENPIQFRECPGSGKAVAA
jgi:hypothetical protein